MQSDGYNIDRLIWGQSAMAPVEEVFNYLDTCVWRQVDIRVISRLKTNLRVQSLIDIQTSAWSTIGR